MCILSEENIFELEVGIPTGVEIQLTQRVLKVTGPKGTLTKDLNHIPVEIRKDKDKILISKGWPKRHDRAMVGTATAHVRNLIKGVTNGFVYKLRVVYAHFPVTIKVQEKERRVLIENFSGEKTPRVARIAEGVKVKVTGDEVVVEGISLDAVSETASNIQRSTLIKEKDQRVFLDGLYIFEKGASA